ncbi:diguanylate cyclase [Pseudoroseomonas rhizosphaerae]|uniref:Diguanylate cyclase n=1 Tax=Teichococcus rhizosphaerae TaxID=1335062 RepID=A0A2C7ADH7_9PROT|nr:bifunctional diguanylate cyclase/phosphodiesterase [Pseudoroseomonas rhizosphaerae]PHK96490.1 diguanylate cyclase [Pseudoroseomonas rhizosphaerae]
MQHSLALPLLDRLRIRSPRRQLEFPLRRSGMSGSLLGLMLGLAALAALAVALVPPASYLLALRAHEAGRLEARAASLAHELGRRSWLVEREDHRGARGILRQAAAPGAVPEHVRLLGADGAVLVEVAPPEPLAAPILTRRAVVPDGAAARGEVEVRRSLRPALRKAGLLSLLCLLLAGGVFTLLRLLPMRMLRRALGEASYLATHDTLTGLSNRQAFQDRLGQALLSAQREGRSVAMLIVDIDSFKEVNDAQGHAAGDMLLREVARRMGQGMRASDTLARIGGDEFAIIQAAENQPQAAAGLARRLLALMEEPVMLEGQPCQVRLSIGIALSRAGQPTDPAQLAHDADMAMHQAKQARQGGYHFHSPELGRKLRERRQLEQDLREAQAQHQFRLAYQPLVYLGTGQVSGGEALLRWHRPGHGDVPPDRFIPVLEESGLIGAVSAWVLETACQEAARWPARMSVAVNVSTAQFRQPGLYEAVEGALRRSGLQPHRLELEITESVLMQDTPETLATLRRLRAMGVRIAMDDFGTGYSSLGYLRRFAFDKIKIDRSFVQHMAQDPNAKAVIRAVVNISQTLGIRALAEGVENAEQAELLRQEGCAEVQGYLFGRPMTPEQFATLHGPGQRAT